MIHECIHQRMNGQNETTMVANEHTVLGITPLSAYTDEEMNALSNFHLLHEFDELINENDSIATTTTTPSTTTTTIVPRLFSSCNFEWNQQRKLPEKFDWRRKGIVTGVKNQATCGSCYAFASISTVESLILRKQQKQRQRYRRSSRHYEYSSFNDDDDDQIWMNKVKPHHHHGHGGDINLSEQHVVNCVGKCHGSSVIKLFNFLRNEGITYEHLEPYNNKVCDVYSFFFMYKTLIFLFFCYYSHQNVIIIIQYVFVLKIFVSIINVFIRMKK